MQVTTCIRTNECTHTARLGRIGFVCELVRVYVKNVAVIRRLYSLPSLGLIMRMELNAERAEVF